MALRSLFQIAVRRRGGCPLGPLRLAGTGEFGYAAHSRRLPGGAMSQLPALALPLLLAGAAAGAGSGPDTSEPGSREAIAAATTEPRFLSPWVADVPDDPKVPSPSDFLGHIAGAPGELTHTDKIYAYYR